MNRCSIVPFWEGFVLSWLFVQNPCPLELLCRLHAAGVLHIEDYIALWGHLLYLNIVIHSNLLFPTICSNVHNPQVIAELSRSLLACCQLSGQNEAAMFTFSGMLEYSRDVSEFKSALSLFFLGIAQCSSGTVWFDMVWHCIWDAILFWDLVFQHLHVYWFAYHIQHHIAERPTKQFKKWVLPVAQKVKKNVFDLSGHLTITN